MKKYIYSFLALSCLLISLESNAIAPPGQKSKKMTPGNLLQSKAANCSPATALTTLDINNVSALIETGGSMWQNRSTGTAAYEVPKGSGTTVIYSGALWMGGVDANNQLKIAAVDFRQGNDFWTGPLSNTPGSGNPLTGTLDYGPATVDAGTCLEYDGFYITTRAEVEEFVAWWECKEDPNCNHNTLYPNYVPPSSITDWPAHGDVSKFQDVMLAPFYDNPNAPGGLNGVYDPINDGDYPGYDLHNNECHTCGGDRQVYLRGDYNVWWVFNDKGNIHTETGGDPIGMEIKAQAFAFNTNDEINNMTFYNYEMINRSTQTLYNTYFGNWVDPDIGCSGDDYVGCDVSRGLGYAYNGEAVDGASGSANCQGATPYGASPPAVGVDFFEGPYQDNDGMDNPGPYYDTLPDGTIQLVTPTIGDAMANDGIVYKGMGIGYGDGCVDNERFGMRKFVYYTNPGSSPPAWQEDPDVGIDYYNYLRGIWMDGTPLTHGSTGHAGPVNANYAFPGDSDPLKWSTQGAPTSNWSEEGEGNPVGDRRFLQSAGPFTLEPGAVNNITVGVVYARTSSTDPFESVVLLQQADDKAQALFDNCFQITEGPDAPILAIQELDQELILSISYPENHIGEDYEMTDKIISALDPSYDNKYRFEGYQIYQLVDGTVGPDQLNDPDKARVVAQCDIKNGITQIVNFEYDETIGYANGMEMVNGKDEGLVHSFKVTEDEFAQGDRKLINFKKYHYMAIAYGYNNYLPFVNDENKPGQSHPYLASRKSARGGNIEVVNAVPHKPSVEQNGTIQLAEYGDGPKITRIEGWGNGWQDVDLTPESEEDIVKDYKVDRVTYQNKKGPVNIKVIDPLNVVNADFELRFFPDTNNQLLEATWELTNLTTGEVIPSDKAIDVGNEQLIPEWGISVDIEQYAYPTVGSLNNEYSADLITSSIEFEDSSKRWLSGVEDIDGQYAQNWIRSGTVDVDASTDPIGALFNDYIGYDDLETFEMTAEGTWAPYFLCATQQEDTESGVRVEHAPITDGSLKVTRVQSKMKYLHSVDIVFTSDKSKWTRCPVVEMQDNPDLAADNVNKQEIRTAPSVDKYGAPDGTGTGMSWFPGYAIDLTTGERLNMAFSEDSWLGNENGRDMMFNPTENMYTNFGEALFGGKHYVYVFRNSLYDQFDNNTHNNGGVDAYDGGNNIEQLIKGGNSDKMKLWRSCMWVGMPILTPGEQLLSTTARVRLRVATEYADFSPQGYFVTDAGSMSNSQNNWNNLYEFSTADIATTTEDQTTADSVLALVNVVPNPYMAYSNYETHRLENKIKITNLPVKCDVKIYTVSGTLVRSLSKDNDLTWLDWDLKNHAGVPIASGMYLIHVDAPGIGERVLKWFGQMRAPDMENF